MSQPVRTPGGHLTRGVELLGVGSAVPEGRITNKDLEKIIDTDDEWIVKRTGIKERRKADDDDPAPALGLCAKALNNALEHANLTAADFDLLILGTVTGEMLCPSTACRVAAKVGNNKAGAFDLAAACCGFLYGLNLAESLIAAKRYERIAVVGCDVMSRFVEYSEAGRGNCILFGDAAGAAIVGPSDDPSKGCIYQSMYADGEDWDVLYIPRKVTDLAPGADPDEIAMGKLRMNGREVYKFAVSRFQDVLAETLEESGVKIDDIAMVIAHQSNLRILESARRRFGIPTEKMFVNIGQYGNSSAGSVGLCLDELWKSNRIKRGDKVLFVAFGGGMTWSSALWQL